MTTMAEHARCESAALGLELPSWVEDPTDIEQVLTYYRSVVIEMTRNRVEWERTNDPKNLQKDFAYQEVLWNVQHIIVRLTMPRVADDEALIAQSKALRAEFASLMSDMFEANAVLANVIEQSRQIQQCSLCDD